jgi:hypothetical protein
LNRFDRGRRGDTRVIHGSGWGYDGHNFGWIVGLGGSFRAEIEWQKLVNGEILRCENPVEAFK